MKQFAWTALAMGLFLAAPLLAHAECILTPISEDQLPQILRGRGVLGSTSPEAILFTSGLERDEDGSPTAYHRGTSDGGPDAGMDHICNGADVLELKNNRLVNKYYPGGSVGHLDKNKSTGVNGSALCKADYIKIRDAGFPKCGTSDLCMRWFGVAVEPRSCGFDRASDTGCGIPILQKDAQGKDNGFYLTTNTLVRPGAPGNSRVQSDYADATKVPFIVIPGGLKLPNDQHWRSGDLAVVAWKGKVAYGVVGDQGPSNKLGEASRALLQQLGTLSVDPKDPATTLLFPGSSSRILTHWPLAASGIKAAVLQHIKQTKSVSDYNGCPGLSALH